MIRRRIGEVLSEQGALTQAQVQQILALQAQRSSGRFGELGLELGLLSEAQVSTAIAEQFQLKTVSAERLRRLAVAEQVADLVTPDFMGRWLAIPTFLEPTRRVLTVIVADPTAVSALRELQEAARAERLRIFVATPADLREMLGRLFPKLKVQAPPLMPNEPEPQPAPTVASPSGPLVFEPDEAIRDALRGLAEAEDEQVLVTSDPNQVTALLDGKGVRKVTMRTELEPRMGASMERWRRRQPDLEVELVEAYSPGGSPGVRGSHDTEFFLKLVEYLLLASEGRQLGLRARIRRTAELARGAAEELDLPDDQRTTVALAALFLHTEKLTAVGTLAGDAPSVGHAVSRFATAMAVLDPHRPPFPLEDLFRVLEQRLSGDAGPGHHLGAEVLFTAGRVADRDAGERTEVQEILGEEASEHDPAVMMALSRVLRRQALRARLEGVEQSDEDLVVLAEWDARLQTSMESRFRGAGLRVAVASNGDDALEAVKRLRPAALIASMRLPRMDGLSLLLTLKRDPELEPIPVFLLTAHGGPRDVARGLDLGAEEVIEKPVNMGLLITRIKRSISRRSKKAESPVAGGIRGRLEDLPLSDLLQTLALGGRTAEVAVTTPKERGLVYLRQGSIVHSLSANGTGEEAVYTLINEGEGEFAVQFDRGAPGHNVRRSTDFVLLEALRRLDEGRRRRR